MTRLLALVVLLAGSAEATGFGRGGGLTCPKGYVGGGLTPCTLPRAYFEFAPTDGSGMGAACAGTDVAAMLAGKGALAVTVTRASVAECISNDGQTITQIAANKPVISSGTSASSVLGIWTQKISTNLLTYGRDLSNAAWAKTNMSCLRNASGMRGDASGASTCTAMAPNATVCQPIVAGSAIYSGSGYLKRSTGVGVINVSLNGGSNWYPVSDQLSSLVWGRVVSIEVAGCAGGHCIFVPEMTYMAAATNPSICVQVVSSGDSFESDFWQIEAADAPSSPIDVGATSATRAADVIQVDLGSGFPLAGHVGSWGVSTVGSLMSGIYANIITASAISFADASGRSATWIWANVNAGNATCLWGNSAGSLFGTPVVGCERSGRTSCVSAVNLSGQSGINPMPAVGPLTGTFPPVRYLTIGSAGGTGAYNPGGVLKQVCLDSSTTACVGADWVTPSVSDVMWIGDSIIANAFSAPKNPTALLQSRLKGRRVINGGINGHRTGDCATHWAANRLTTASTVIWSCGANDVLNSVSGSTAATTAEVALADMRSLGKRVIITGISPFGSYAGYTAPFEAERQAYNAAQSTWASSHGAYYVSTDSMGAGSPLALTAANDGGDGLHWSPAGALAGVDLVMTQGP